MYFLRTFGTLAVERDGVPIETLATHRNALATLAVLAADGSTSRDRLMALLWPESDTPRARGSLKQILHFLRQQLQAPEFMLGRPQLALDPGVIGSDIQRFRDALAAGDQAAAVALYRGPFLDGIHLSGSEELETWVESKRGELARDYGAALESLARKAEDRNDLPEATSWWRRLQEHEPLDGRVALQYMRALVASGQRAAALQYARAHERLLRTELDLAPDPAIAELVEQLRSAPAAPLFPARAPEAEEVSDPLPAASSRGPRRRVAAAAIAVASLLLALATRERGGAEAEGPMDPDLLAVAPFDVLDPSLQLWREGLTDILAQDLDGAGPVRTVAPSVALRRWAGRADRPSANDLGARTGAGIVVFGTVVRHGADSVSIRATVLDRARQSAEPRLEVTGPEQRMGELADSLGVRILRLLGRSRPIASSRHVSIGSRSLPALREFLRGEQFYRLGELDSALAHYDRAITEDSTFALALRRMAWSLGGGAATSWRYAPQRDYRRRSVNLNRGLAPRDSILLLSDSLVHFGGDTRSPDEWVANRLRAGRLLEGLARRYPDDPAIWYELAEMRVHMPPPLGGFAGPALEALDRAIVLDPGFAPGYMHAVEFAVMLGRLDLARQYAGAYRQLNPEYMHAPGLRLVSAIFDSGVNAPGVRRQMQAATVSTLVWVGLDHLSWWTDSAETDVEVLRELVRGQHDATGVQAFAGDSLMWRQYLASALAYRGHLKEAAQVNQRLIADPGASVHSARSDPFVDLALFGAVDEAVARRSFARSLTRGATWSGTLLGVPPRHLRGLPWWLARGDTVSIVRFGRRAAEVARSDTQPVAVLRGRYYTAAAAAYLALLRGDSAGAERRFLAISDTLCLVGYCFGEKVALAQLLAARGKDQEAAAVLDRWSTVAAAPRPMVVLAALERARIAERLRDRRTAAERYRFVLDAWPRPDPVLQVFVDEARAGLVRMDARAATDRAR